MLLLRRLRLARLLTDGKLVFELLKPVCWLGKPADGGPTKLVDELFGFESFNFIKRASDALRTPWVSRKSTCEVILFIMWSMYTLSAIFSARLESNEGRGSFIPKLGGHGNRTKEFRRTEA